MPRPNGSGGGFASTRAPSQSRATQVKVGGADFALDRKGRLMSHMAEQTGTTTGTPQTARATFKCGHSKEPANRTVDGRCRICKRANDRAYTTRHIDRERARKREFALAYYYRRKSG